MNLKRFSPKYQKIIHIEDEYLPRKSWRRYFESKGILVLSFATIAEFKEFNSDRKFETLPVFIDSFLGDEQRGEDFAKELSEFGFEMIFLASAHTKHLDLTKYPWIRDSIGKNPAAALSFLFE